MKQYEEIKSELSEIKTLLSTLANGKAEEKQTEEEVAKLKEQKEIMQAISRGMSSVLENVKKL